jgi:hypothetical protein
VKTSVDIEEERERGLLDALRKQQIELREALANLD